MKTLLALLLCAVLHQTLADHDCIYSCMGLDDGDYTWCGSCVNYLSCTNGKASVMPCPEGTLFSGEYCTDNRSACHADVSSFDPCAADLCDHGRCSPDGSDYYCTCKVGWKGKNCDCLITPCNPEPTPFVMGPREDIVHYFPSHGACYNKHPITKTLCRGECVEPDERCVGLGRKTTPYKLICDDGFKFWTTLNNYRRCDCIPVGEEECAPQAVMRPIAYFEFRHAGGDYINLAPVSQMICGGSCSDNENERCVRRNNMFELVEVTITNTVSGAVDTYMMENDVECDCLHVGPEGY